MPTITADDVDMSGPYLLVDLTATAPMVVEVERLKNGVYYAWGTFGPFSQAVARVKIATWFDTYYRFRVRYASCSTFGDWKERYVRPHNPVGSNEIQVVINITPATGPVVDVPIPDVVPGPGPTDTEDPDAPGNQDGCKNGSSGDHNDDGHKDCGKGGDKKPKGDTIVWGT